MYDALTSRRVYKEPYSHKISVEKIKQGAGRHFDPHLVDIFLSIESQFEEIAISLRAPDESSPSRNNQGEDRVEDLMTEEAGDLIEAVTSVIAGSPGYHVLP